MRYPDLIEAVGYAAAFLTTAAFIPQAIKTWRSQSAGDLSLAWLLTFTSGVALWLGYGLAVDSKPIIAANVATLALTLLLLAFKLRDPR